MHKSFLSFFRNKKFIYQSFFLFNVFLTACSSETENESEAFLRKILLEEGGVYTLLGDKPITDLLIYKGGEESISLEGLSRESLEKIEYGDDSTFKDWNSWKKFSKKLNFKNFRFVERPCLNDPSYVMYLLVNIETLKKLLQEYNSLFSNEILKNFNIDQVINELDNPKSIFWNEAFKNHYICGLLHGYGEENSAHFKRIMSGEIKASFSEKFEDSITQDNFPLPIFAVADNESMVKKYRQQRSHIQKIYRDKNFLKTTLEFLCTGQKTE